METQEQIKYQYAQKRVSELKKFYQNFFTYLVVITFLAGLNYYQNEWRYIWFLWPAFGWGIGIVFHAIKAFEINPVFNKDWEERKIKEFIEQQEEQNLERWE